jgi:uncharacterized protein
MNDIAQLVLQPTSFCNIDCRYCYLPQRSRIAIMSEATLEATFRQILGSAHAGSRLLVVWSLGEPLSVPISFYEVAFAIAEKYRAPGTAVGHHFQTNGTLLNDEWCRFIKENGVAIGVSIDGPRELHDANRKTRGGRGTFDQTMRGIGLLQRHEIDFGVISVVGADALDQPDLLFDFYEANGFRRVGLNVEEIDGVNTASSLNRDGVEKRFRQFMRQMFLRLLGSKNVTYLREYRPSDAATLAEPFADPNTEQRPGIVSVDVDGNFTLLGPELLGAVDADGEPVAVGNFNSDSFSLVLQSMKFRQQMSEVEAGVDACRRSCRYFSICGGGPPSNKFFETGTFASTETLYCRLMCQATADVTVEIVSGKNLQGATPV